MPLIIKMMSSEDAEDADTRKCYELFTNVVNVGFNRDGPSKVPVMVVIFADADDPEAFEVTGNVYIMNENGKTISSFGYAPL